MKKGSYPAHLKEPRSREEEAELWLSVEEHKPLHMAEERINGLATIEIVKAFLGYENAHEKRPEVIGWITDRAAELQETREIASTPK